MTENERKYVDLTARVEELTKQVAKLEDEKKHMMYDRAQMISEIVRLRRFIESQDLERHELLTKMAEQAVELRKAERWLKIYRKR